MAAFPLVVTQPSLGQVNVVPAEQTVVEFVVLIEWHTTRPAYPFEVQICYVHSPDSTRHESTWASLPATRTNDPHVVEGPEHETGRITTFAGRVSKSEIQKQCHSGVINFTVKYRVDKLAPWQWVSSQAGAAPGILVLQAEEGGTRKGIENVLNLEPGWSTVALPTSSEQATVYKLESDKSIPKTTGEGNEEQLNALALGTVRSHVRYFALVRAQPYWLEPRHGRDTFYLTEDALLCSFLTTSGHVLTVVTITGQDSTYSVFQSDSQGRIAVSARCDSDKDVKWHALAAIASTFEESCSAVMAAARQIVSDSASQQQVVSTSPTATSTDAQDKIEKWLDGLAFCTWNGLGQNLTQEKIMIALDSLLTHNVRISTLLIDDNWQTVGPIPDQDYENSFQRGFADLQANTDVAPNGLANLITKIKSSYPHIQDIGVWHALLGYWGGISPSGQIAQTYQTTQIPSYLMGNHAATITSIAAPDIPRFFTDFYTYLSTAGISFIKTDVQHMLSTFRSRSARLSLIPTYQSAWTASHTRFFSAKAISCMSQIPEILWSPFLLLPTNTTPRIPLRNSDDFYPEIPASHPWHIWTNAHNALFTRHLAATPDWDMFQTIGAYASYHAAARCISGGPVMITDVPGEHSAEILRQIAAVDSRRRSVALRPRAAAASTRVFDEYRSERGGAEVLKIGSVCANGDGLLGLWNVAEKEVGCLVAVAEVPGLREVQAAGTGEVMLRSHRMKTRVGPLDLGRVLGGSGGGDGSATQRRDLLYVNLPVRGWDVFTAHPVYRVEPPSLGGKSVAVAVHGLTDKISGAAAIVDATVASREGADVVVGATLKALGEYSVWLDLPSDARIAECRWKLPGKGVEGKVEAWSMAEQEAVLTLDLVAIWEENGLFKEDAEVEDVQVGVEIVFERQA